MQEVGSQKLWKGGMTKYHGIINPLNAKLNPTCHFPALLGAHPILHVSRIRVKHVEYLFIQGGTQK